MKEEDGEYEDDGQHHNDEGVTTYCRLNGKIKRQSKKVQVADDEEMREYSERERTLGVLVSHQCRA